MSKSIDKMSADFDLVEYLTQLLSNNQTNNSLRKRIQNDIQLTKKQISEQLSTFDIDFNDFNSKYKQIIELKKEIEELEKQLNEFIESDLITKIEELKDICHQSNDRFNRSKRLSHFIEKFKQMKSEISLIDESFSLQSYESSVEYMTSASELYHFLIESIESNEDLTTISKDLNKFLSSLKVELTLKKEELIYKTKKLFNSNVKVFRDEFNNENVFEFNLIKCLNSNEYKKFIKTFIGIEKNSFILSDLIKNLELFFIKPILNEEINHLVLEDNKIIAKFVETKPLKPLSALKLFFDYFNRLLTNDNQIIVRQLLAIMGSIWTKDLFQHILKYYLNRLMPKNESQLKSYLSLIDSAEDIRHYLIEIGFIEKSTATDESTTSPFLEFALNINTHFCRRLCTDFVISAKTIISRELHQTIQFESDLQNNSNSLPSLRVSQSMIELKQLIQNIMDLTNNCTNQCSEALLETISDICELYIDVSPVFHNKMINEFPQQNAIFHNNCIFFAHFIESFAESNPKLNILSKFVPILRELGSQLFLKQMRIQEKLLLELIQTQDFTHCLNDLATEDKSGYCEESAKKLRHYFQQCLVHLKFLKSTLIVVLPEKLYQKSIGTVVNTLFNELINKIQIQNDISTSGAVRLSEEIDFLFKEIKELLKPENPLRFVQKWSKLSELHFILNVGSIINFVSIYNLFDFKATLLDIVNRWADGRGILAAEYTSQEVKQLIRALFQNTERRALALNKITNHSF